MSLPVFVERNIHKGEILQKSHISSCVEEQDQWSFQELMHVPHHYCERITNDQRMFNKKIYSDTFSDTVCKNIHAIRGRNIKKA